MGLPSGGRVVLGIGVWFFCLHLGLLGCRDRPPEGESLLVPNVRVEVTGDAVTTWEAFGVIGSQGMEVTCTVWYDRFYVEAWAESVAGGVDGVWLSHEGAELPAHFEVDYSIDASPLLYADVTVSTSGRFDTTCLRNATETLRWCSRCTLDATYLLEDWVLGNLRCDDLLDRQTSRYGVVLPGNPPPPKADLNLHFSCPVEATSPFP